MVPRTLSILLLMLTLLVIGSVVVFEIAYANRIYPGVWIWDVDVGGLRLEEAAGALGKGLDHNKPLLILRGPEDTWPTYPADAGLRLDTQATLAPAYQLGREGGWADNLAAQFRLLVDRQILAPVYLHDRDATHAYVQGLADQLYVPPTDATLSFEGATPSITPGRAGRYVDVDATLTELNPAVTALKPAAVDLIVHETPPRIADAGPARAEAEALLAEPLTLMLADPREGDPGPWTIPPEQLVALLKIQERDGELHAVPDPNAVQAYLEGLAPQIAIAPVDARFGRNEWTGQLAALSPSADGRTLDTAASAARIADEMLAGQRYIPLIVQAVPSHYPDTATAGELGVTDLVATGESYFIGSPSGRDHNIRLAAAKFHGIVVAPGETFSFNHYLGPVTAEAGYDESFITAGEQLQMGIGGGICQVSTTMFRAAFWGGYPVTERWYHYQRVGYYELYGGGVGMDATVFSPQVDLKFRNDRPYPLLIQAEIDEAAHRLTFRFYSTDGGRRVEMKGPEITDEIEPGPPIYELDETMEPGTVKKWQSAVGGLTATVERTVVDEHGNVIYRDVFVSKYAPRRAAYHYGPGYEPPE